MVGEGNVVRGEGNWPEISDRITPMQPLIESLREALGLITGMDDAPTTPTGQQTIQDSPTGTASSAQQVSRERIKQALGGRTLQEYYEQERASRGSKAAAQSAVDRLRNIGVNLPEEHDLVKIARGPGSAQTTTPAGEQKAAPVVPSNPNLSNKAFDPTGSSPTPAAAQSTGTVDWSEHESGRRILEAAGIDPDGYTDAEYADKALSQLELTASKYEKTVEDGPGTYSWNRMADILEGGGWDVAWMREHDDRFR
jgi:hypothetical protein